MSQDNLITLYNDEAKEHIVTKMTKALKTSGTKLSLKKYSKKLKKHVLFTQTKKRFKKK